MAAVKRDYRKPSTRFSLSTSAIGSSPSTSLPPISMPTSSPHGNKPASRYTADDGSATVLRSRWVRLDEGWRVTQVRNIPATPPVMPSAGPREDGLDTPHWEGLREGEVRVQRCARCGHWIWAPQPVCPRCHGFELSWPAVEPAGTVYSWTRTWQ